MRHLKILGIIALAVTSFASEPVGDLAPPEPAGITFAQLEALGDRADSELVKRFAKSENGRFREGLLQRMASFGNFKHPSDQIRDELIRFVEGEVAECAGEVSFRRTWIIGVALEIIGERGGAKGIEYLKGWIMDPKVYGRIRCFAHTREPQTTQDELRCKALMGIGDSGSRDGLQFLREVEKHRPPSKYPGSFGGVLDTAISVSEQIQKEGYVNYYEAQRKLILNVAGAYHQP